VTAVVVSFPQERTFRTRQDQVEMRKAYRIARGHHPGSGPSDLWERALCAVRVAQAFKTKVENASEALKKESDKKARAHQDFKARPATEAAPVLPFPPNRIFRDRQTQIEIRKGCQLIRRKNPKMPPSVVWEGAVIGMAIKAGWDQRREQQKREEAMRQDLRDMGAMSDEGFAAFIEVLRRNSLATRRGFDQPPPGAA